jgi:PAS domain S-box-containing protein
VKNEVLKGNDLVTETGRRLQENAQELSGLKRELERKMVLGRILQETLRASEEKFRELVENISIGIAVISPEMQILSLNKQMHRWFPDIDMTKTPICFRVFWQPPKENICELCPTRKTVEDGRIHEGIVQKNGHNGKAVSYQITAMPIKDKRGLVTAAIEMFEDVTERMRLERIALNAAHLRHTIEDNKDGFLVVDENGIVLFTNPVTELLFGREQDRFVGTPFGFPVGEGQSTEIEIANGKSGKHYAEMHVLDIEWDQEPAHLILVRDITDLKHIREISEELSEQKRRDEAKGEFISMVSHELRTPMTIMRESISQVLDGLHGQTTLPQKQLLLLSIENINRLNRIVDNLLDVSKVEAGRMQIKRELVDIVGLFQEISAGFEPACRNKGLVFLRKFPREKIEIYLDKDKITQVVVNLIGNAIKFTESGCVELFVGEEEGRVKCTVSDTGRGISEKDIARVFDKYEQFGRIEGQGEKGTGLGLTISKHIIELHQGKIWVESELGKGSKFSFVLAKFSARDLLKENIGRSLKNAQGDRTPLSVIAFEIKNYDYLQHKLGRDKVASFMNDLERLLKTNLRPKHDEDLVFKASRAILVMLPQTHKEYIKTVIERNRVLIEESISEGILDKEAEIIFRAASFPDDAETEDALLGAIGV